MGEYLWYFVQEDDHHVDPHDDPENLTQADLDNRVSHRLDDVPGIRKHIINRPMKKRVKLSTAKKSGQKDTRSDIIEYGLSGAKSPVKTKNRQTHEVFVELDELVVGNDKEVFWKEKARWIKFEEDVEDNDRWGKPHIASLSFISLWEVRKGMEKAKVQK